MNELYLEIAEFRIAIRFKIDMKEDTYLFIKKNFEDDMVFSLRNFFIEKPNKIDFTVDIIIPDSIETKVDESGSMYAKLFSAHKNHYTVPLQISQSQFRMVLLNVIHKLLAKHNGFVMHSSAAAIGGKAYLFLGESGAGKSTTARLLSRNYPIVGDDSGIIRKKGRKYYFYSTPFIEKVPWIRRERDRFPVGGLVFHKKDNSFRLEKVTNNKSILDKVVNQLIVTDSVDSFVPHVFEFVSKFDDFYFLHFAKDENKLVELFKKINEKN